MRFKKEVGHPEVVLSVFPKFSYNESLYSLLHTLQDKRICYVTLSKPAPSLQLAFKLNKINIHHMFFIDAVSKELGKAVASDNILTVSSPAALTEISIALQEAMKLRVFDVVLFDSLSTLNLYEKNPAIPKFVSHIINRIKNEKRQAFFTCLQEDVNTTLVKNSCLYVDKVIEYHQPSLRRYGQKVVTSIFLLFLGILPLLIFAFGSTNSSLTGLAVADAVTTAPNTFKILLFVSSAGLLLAGIFFLHLITGPHPVRLQPHEIHLPQKLSPSARAQVKQRIRDWMKT